MKITDIASRSPSSDTLSMQWHVNPDKVLDKVLDKGLDKVSDKVYLLVSEQRKLVSESG